MNFRGTENVRLQRDLEFVSRQDDILKTSAISGAGAVERSEVIAQITG